MALLAFVLHENVDRKRLLDEVMRILLPEGKLLIIEWKKQEEENGPPRGERLGRDELATELSGFAVLEEGSLNGSHYYMVVQRGRIIHGH
jgi:hypothetical protein